MTALARSQVLEVLARHRDGAVAVAGPGATSGGLWAAGHRAATVYNMEMGYATPVALGIALACPWLRVVALEGDGSAVAGLPALTTVGRYRPPNLAILLFDNGVFGTGGGDVETATRHGTSLAAAARACGIPAPGVVEVDDLAASEAAVAAALVEDGPWVVVAHVSGDDVRSAGRPAPGIGHVEAAVGMRRALADLRAGEGSPP